MTSATQKNQFKRQLDKHTFVSKNTMERKIASNKRKQMSIHSFFSSTPVSRNDTSKTNVGDENTPKSSVEDTMNHRTFSTPSTPPTPPSQAKEGLLQTPETPPSPCEVQLGTPDTSQSAANLSTPPSTSTTSTMTTNHTPKEHLQQYTSLSTTNQNQKKTKVSCVQTVIQSRGDYSIFGTPSTITTTANCKDYNNNTNDRVVIKSVKNNSNKNIPSNVVTKSASNNNNNNNNTACSTGTPTLTLHDVSTPLTTTFKTAKRTKILQQMYIDLGQENFGKQTICSTCGMLFVHGLTEDSKEHQKICTDHLKGVPFSLPNNNNYSSPVARIVATFQPQSSSSRTVLLGGGGTIRTTPTGSSNILSSSRMSYPMNSKTNNNSNNHDCIVEIRPTDSYALRHKVSRVKAIVDQELGFFSSTNDNNNDDDSNGNKQNDDIPSRTAYLYVSNKRIVGMVTAEIITQAYPLLTTNNSNTDHHPEITNKNNNGIKTTKNKNPTIYFTSLERSHTPTKAVIGIHQLWVHSNSRQCGIATKLLDTIRSKMVFGYIVPPECVAFSSPTEAGARFANTYMIKSSSASSSTRTSYSNTTQQTGVKENHPPNSITTEKQISSHSYPPVLVYDCK